MHDFAWFLWNAWTLDSHSWDTLSWILTTPLWDVQATWAAIYRHSSQQSLLGPVFKSSHLKGQTCELKLSRWFQPQPFESSWAEVSDISHGVETSHLLCVLFELLTHRIWAHIKIFVYFTTKFGLLYYVAIDDYSTVSVHRRSAFHRAHI